MKKTVLVSVITTILTVALIMFLVHMFSYCCNESSCERKEKCVVIQKDCQIKAELKALRAEFDQELNDEEKQVINDSRANLEGFEHDAEMGQDEHEADFKALAVIAENHKESLDAVKAKMHDTKCMQQCCNPHKACCDKHRSCCDKKKACCEKKIEHKCPEGEAEHAKLDEHKCPEGEAEHAKLDEHKCPEYKSCGEKNCGHKSCGEKLAAHKSPEKEACCEKKKAPKCLGEDAFSIHFLLMEY